MSVCMCVCVLASMAWVSSGRKRKVVCACGKDGEFMKRRRETNFSHLRFVFSSSETVSICFIVRRNKVIGIFSIG